MTEKGINDIIGESFINAGKDASSTDLVIEVLKLRSKVPVTKVQPEKSSIKGKNSKIALKGERKISRGSDKVVSRIYEWNKLKAGNVVAGPAVLEGSDTTYVVSQGWQLTMDAYGNGAMERS